MSSDKSASNFAAYLTSAALFILLIGTANPGHAEIYRWVDDNGAVHYSDKKPNNRQSETVHAQTGKSSSTTATGESPQQRAQALDAQQQKATEIAQREAAMAEEKAKVDAQCETIRENLKKIEENNRIKVEEKGSTRFLSAEEIIERKNSFQKMLDEHCN